MAESKKVKVRQNAFVNYVQASIEELRKVTWPTKNQAIRLTFLVLGFCVVTAALLGVLDYAFSTGHQALLNLAPGEAYEDLIDMPTPIVNPIDVSAEGVTGEPITVTTGEEEVVEAVTTAESTDDVVEPVAEAADTETTTP